MDLLTTAGLSVRRARYMNTIGALAWLTTGIFRRESLRGLVVRISDAVRIRTSKCLEASLRAQFNTAKRLVVIAGRSRYGTPT